MLSHSESVLLVTINIILTGSAYFSDQSNSSCPIWHSFDQASGCCECCSIQLNIGVFDCNLNGVEILQGHCMSWNSRDASAEVGRCLFIYKKHNTCYKESLLYAYSIPTNISGSELNNFICKDYNRKGAQCRQCIDSYGPAVFSDGITCADCSKHRYHWILYLTFQLTMVTIMYLAVVLFEINGTASPLNIIITYSQLSTTAIMVGSGFHVSLACSFSTKWVILYLTLFGTWNLDFFRLILPPVCVSISLKTVYVLLFDYVIALYPLFLTVFMLVGIELYDRNCSIAICLSIPLKKICLKGSWNPKETILKTCATFLLLSYSKFLFVSANLLLAVPIYNCRNGLDPASTVLLYDPTIRFLHSEHIPYVILAFFIIIIFVLLPPLLLLLYPTRCFRAYLGFMGFKRWDILHLVMDIFQGWFKDRTDDSIDYRFISALYMLLQILFPLVGIAIILNIFNRYYWLFLGLLHAILGVLFLVLKPYKKNWMNCTDGLILLLLGSLMLTIHLDPKFTFVVAIVSGTMVIVSLSMYFIGKYVRKFCCV